jgi:hypothetical protein
MSSVARAPRYDKPTVRSFGTFRQLTQMTTGGSSPAAPSDSHDGHVRGPGRYSRATTAFEEHSR